MPALLQSNSQQGRVYQAALDADVPVTPTYLAKVAGVPSTAMGTVIRRLLASGLFIEVGQIVPPLIPELGITMRKQRLYLAQEVGDQDELTRYAPRLFTSLLQEQLSDPLDGYGRLAFAMLTEAAQDSIRCRDLSWFVQQDGTFTVWVDMLGLDPEWVSSLWQRLYHKTYTFSEDQ